MAKVCYATRVKIEKQRELLQRDMVVYSRHEGISCWNEVSRAEFSILDPFDGL